MGGSEQVRTLEADQKRALIIDHAARLFDERGYGNTSMSDIARATRLAKPSLYHYFRSKDEILMSIHEEFVTVLLAKHEERRGQDLTARDDLLGIITDIVTILDTHRGHVRTFFEHVRELQPSEQVVIRAKRDRFRANVVQTLERGIAHGEFSAELDPRLAAWAILGMANWTYQWYVIDGKYSSREIAGKFFDIVMSGIEKA